MKKKKYFNNLYILKPVITQKGPKIYVLKPIITKKSLKTVDSIRVLNNWIKNSNNSKKKELIKVRMIEVLGKIFDINALNAFFNKHWEMDLVLEFIVRARIIEVLNESVPESDINEIVDCWNKRQSVTHDDYKLLRKKTKEVLGTINDIEILFCALKKVYNNSWLNEQIDNRMEHILRKVLPEISDINTLIVWDKKICNHYKGKVDNVAAHNCILWRMEELLSDVFDIIILISYWNDSCCCKSPVEYQFEKALNKISDVKEFFDVYNKIPASAYKLREYLNLRSNKYRAYGYTWP